MDVKSMPNDHLEAIKASLRTGFQVYQPENVALDIHRPFKTSDGRVRGSILFEEDINIADKVVRVSTAVPYVLVEYAHAGETRIATSKITDADGEIYHPRSDKEAAVCFYCMINRAQKKPLYADLGKAWEEKLSTFIGKA